jgi:hypothetical protein
MNGRGQITIFIIIGALIVSGALLYFLIRGGAIPGLGGKVDKNPNAFLESCIEDKLREGIEIISLQGGYVENPLNIAFKFESDNEPHDISYLCYNQNDYSLCVNQEPMLISHLEEELFNYISGKVDDCFNNRLTASLEKLGYVVDARYSGFDMELMENRIVTNLDAELTLTKGGETSRQENFNLIFPSKFYDLALVVQDIINIEATTGDFNHFYVEDYPEFDISQYRTADSSIIYTVKPFEGGEIFRFAIRGAVIPSGFGLNF